ncbi:BTB/POZ protein [Rhizophagus clarus]|uniref:BTB/POZ protein n=1 Tax=Rhizophagus clarus TaxID=94130 RepID=A0A8H3QLT6_9GLOM|nr:BTB/POZ protein [Rhizophagus clarus]
MEYEVFHDSAILAAKQVSNDAYRIFIEWLLPTLEQKNSTDIIEPIEIIPYYNAYRCITLLGTTINESDYD